ncbi:forkhead box protein N3-like isoform X2 [Planococcus citri]
MRVAPDRPDHSENVGIALSQNPVTSATAATVTLYSADGLIAVQEEHDGVVADVPQIVSNSAGDDDLTSLTWLQDKNLLKSVHELPKHEFIDDSASDSAFSNSSASSTSSHKSSNQSINVISRVSYDPQVHVNSKPPFSFSCLIFMAIEDSADKALPVKDIYVWILNHFPYYRNAPTGWKNSVRHNLSLNKCFKKVDKSPNLGKGSLWMVEQRFRPCLIQALQKTPYHQYHKFIRNSGTKKNISENPDIRDTESVKKSSPTCVEEKKKVTPTSNEISASSPPTPHHAISIKDNLSDDIDAAATAMLVLKHGACAFDIKTENVDFVLRDGTAVTGSRDKSTDENPAFSSCPNEDHNYGYHHYNSVKSEPDCVSSTSAANKDTLNSDYWNSVKEDEEQRKIVEGADALLNLAGITTTSSYNMRKRSLSSSEDQQRSVKHCPEQTSYRPRLLRKEKTSKVNCKESISTETYETSNEVTNYYTISKSSSNENGDSAETDKSKFQNSRTAVTNGRKPRKKLEKKKARM